MGPSDEEIVVAQGMETPSSINGALRDAIADIPAAMRSITADVAMRAEDIAAAVDTKVLRYIHFTGCGDSYYAGIAAAMYVEATTTFRSDALEALECSRYTAARYGPADLVVAISNSGRVSRTIEATLRARDRGAVTIAVTDRGDSNLAASAQHTLLMGLPARPSGGAGTRSYVGSLVSAYLIGAAFAAKEAGTREPLDRCIQELERTAGAIQATLESVAADCRSVAAELARRPTVVVLGAGPHLATALFCAAKLMEAASIHGVVQGLEEWAHEEFHVTDDNLPTILVGPPGLSHDRALEQAAVINALDGPLTVITEDKDDSYFSLGSVLRYRNDSGELFAPFAAAAVASLLGVELADARGVGMRMRLDPKRKQLNFDAIFGSAITR